MTMYESMDSTPVILVPSKYNKTTMEMAKTIRENEGGIIRVLPEVSQCRDCGACAHPTVAFCAHNDPSTLLDIIVEMKTAEKVIFCSPVYCNMPIPSLMAFISVLSMINEHKYGREIFNGVNAEIYMIADVSGTQAAANSLMGALNMIGFSFGPRVVHSYVNNWKDTKIRGGSMHSNYRMPESDFKTLSEKSGA